MLTRRFDQALAFAGGRDGSLWYYGELARFFAGAMPGPLAEELGRTTAAMREA